MHAFIASSEFKKKYQRRDIIFRGRNILTSLYEFGFVDLPIIFSTIHRKHILSGENLQ